MSEKPVIFVTRKLPPDVEARLLRDYQPVLNTKDSAYDADHLVDRAGNCKAVAILASPTEKFDAGVIARLPDRIRVLATFSVGYDHIDIAAAKARDLVVSNTPDVLTDATADITWLCLLGAARQAQSAEAVLRGGTWGRWEPTGMLGLDVTGKRLGIFGMGRIGQAVARRARGFDMKLHYSKRRRLTAEQEAGATYHADPEEMLPSCDFLSMNCAATAET
ncbi:MAG: NAD(P)-dependent oxidoreductase, partial [Alphaproteobacteria bacterium]